jgi:predicted RNA-binding Zn ribbon-like protein
MGLGGERASRASIQPGGRSPAPEPLTVVQAFINTHYDLEGVHGAEVLRSPRALAGWFARHGLLAAGTYVDRADLQRALRVREDLRALARGRSERSLHGLTEAARGGAVEVRLTPSGALFAPGAGSGTRGAIAVLLALVGTAMRDGSWSRLKICPGEDCGWAFYDHSRNQAGRWCSMSVCGARAKARAHYHRQRRHRGEQ